VHCSVTDGVILKRHDGVEVTVALSKEKDTHGSLEEAP